MTYIVSPNTAKKKLDWSDAHKAEFSERLFAIRDLYKRRNAIIHKGYGFTSEDMQGAPAGSAVELQSYGIGFTEPAAAGGWFIGPLAKRVDLAAIDQLTGDFREARMGLAEFATMIDQLPSKPRPFPAPEQGRLLSRP